LKKITQSGFVTGVASQNLIGQRKPFRAQNEGQHDLHTIASLVAAVAKLSFSDPCRIGLEIGAGQVIEQDVEMDMELASPALVR